MVNQSSHPPITNYQPAPRDVSNRSPITLAFLFYIVTFGAIISACLATLVDNETATRQSLQWSMIGGGMIGMMIGCLLGLLRFRRWSLAATGTLSGLCVGLIAGALTLISSENFLQINLIAAVGGWLVVVSMCLTARHKTQPSTV